ncbi:hypothetical protein BKA70DRAFT_1408296 [Coprinopsis sp. MPI-PUGE-AT-0042]|nr:hypothetical protein BKA70DRAFT_1408296 [Coprinopsis sp. MPI-PUGE-AT-0042]
MCGLHPESLADALYNVVVSLSDQQIALGIAILGTAAIRTYDSTTPTPLSTYHLAMVGNIAWLSSNTHLLAILLARSYADSSKPSSPERRDPAKGRTSSRFTRALRAISMLALAGLLLWLSWLGGDSGFYDSVQCPAACLVNSQNGKGGEPKSWMIFNFFYVFYNYTAMLAPQVSGRVRVWWMDHVSLRVHAREGMPPKPIPVVDGWSDLIGGKRKEWSQKRKSRLLNILWAPLKGLARGLLYIIKGFGWMLWIKEGSETISFVELMVYFSLGIYWTVGEWLEANELMEDRRKGATTWGLGQLIPLFLLLIPFFQLIDSYTEYAAYHKRELYEEEGKEKESF